MAVLRNGKLAREQPRLVHIIAIKCPASSPRTRSRPGVCLPHFCPYHMFSTRKVRIVPRKIRLPKVVANQA
jgi:hypothetical protein